MIILRIKIPEVFLKLLTGMQWDHYALMMVKKCSFGKMISLR